MDQSTLSYQDMLEISSQLASCANEMQSNLDEIKTQFNKIGEGDVWSGSAAAEAKSTFDKLSAKFPDFVAAVKDCSDYLNKVVDLYQSVDNQATSSSQV